MNVTLHEVARVLAVRNDISQFEDFDLQKPEFSDALDSSHALYDYFSE